MIPRLIVRTAAALLLWWAVLAAASVAAESGGFAGKTLPQALAELQSSGLTIIFSTALVSDEMVVELEPRAEEPRAILEEILWPHGLAVLQGAGGQLVVIRRGDAAPPVVPVGSIAGQVNLGAEGAGPRLITVRVIGTGLETTVELGGRFRLDEVPIGIYTVEAASPGSRPYRIEGVVVNRRQTTSLVFHLSPASIFLNEIVVTPSHFRILEQTPEARIFLSREDVDQMPHIADDIFRAVKRLPGTAGGDYSATFNIRGGEQEELLVILDGVELYEPFHLKDFHSVFSTVDSEAVGGLDFLTGGFPVQYGDRMSGVMDITTTTPTGPPLTTVSLSTINARVISEGTFNQDRGQWLVNARAWYPDEVFELVGGGTANEVLADYYDLIAKVQHSLGNHSVLSGNLLYAYDDLGFTEQDEESLETVAARYRSHQLWFNLSTNWTETLFSRSVLSWGNVKRNRSGGWQDIEDGSLDVDDHRRLQVYGFKQDWTWELNDSHFFKGGFETRRENAEYDYDNVAVLIDPEEDEEEPEEVEVAVALEPAGTSYAAYLADRFRLGDALVVELGLRWDKQFYIGTHQLSPRLNLIYDLGESTTLRAAWGQFYQSQRLNELQVEDGVDEFYPAQLAEHTMASLEHRFAAGPALRVELYHKKLEDLRPRYENLFNPLELFPEATLDRVRVAPDRGRARGLEVLLRSSPGGTLDWWLTYGLSEAEDFIDGEWVPRSWDQRHAAAFGLNWRLPHEWSLSLAGTWHTGWPTTGVLAVPVMDDEGEVEYELQLDTRNGERMPDYLRFDLRASRSFTTEHGEWRVFLEVLNLANRKNVCCLDDFEVMELEDGSVVVVYKEAYWAPIVPSLGFAWTF